MQAFPALKFQHRNFDTCRQDPEEFARRVAHEYDNAGINYLRWNGGGDLFPEAIAAIEYIRANRPDIVLWIVSRKAELAAQLRYHGQSLHSLKPGSDIARSKSPDSFNVPTPKRILFLSG